MLNPRPLQDDRGEPGDGRVGGSDPWSRRLRAIELEQDRYLLRTELRGCANAALQAVALRPPPLAQPLSGAVDL
jgi:hypothetical protein